MAHNQERQGKYRKTASIAESADRHELYEASVQDAEFETEFVAGIFKKVRGVEPRSLREDFCGTANAACQWVKMHPENTAIGIDLDPEVLAWGRRRHLDGLPHQQAARVSLLNQDVLQAHTEPVD